MRKWPNVFGNVGNSSSSSTTTTTNNNNNNNTNNNRSSRSIRDISLTQSWQS